MKHYGLCPACGKWLQCYKFIDHLCQGTGWYGYIPLPCTPICDEHPYTERKKVITE